MTTTLDIETNVHYRIERDHDREEYSGVPRTYTVQVDVGDLYGKRGLSESLLEVVRKKLIEIVKRPEKGVFDYFSVEDLQKSKLHFINKKTHKKLGFVVEFTREYFHYLQAVFDPPFEAELGGKRRPSSKRPRRRPSSKRPRSKKPRGRK
jgi:hypothetical protein